jgi:glycosyltransferase involved in cell wall biosynthesis
MSHYDKPVGISILTNSNRCGFLRACIDSLLKNCYYRPLEIAIFDNGSTDDTKDFLSSLPKVYGVTWKVESSPVDLGCARGTNLALEMVRGCQYAIHIESDFIHMTEEESGVGKLWLREAIEDVMETGECDYLYLRRMRHQGESMMHWWSQWMPKISLIKKDKYAQCEGFWWSNNPALRRVQSLYDSKTLPLNEAIDGAKGSAGWSSPELLAALPAKAWIYKWGMFQHETIENEYPEMTGCGVESPHGTSSCKYGFYLKDGHPFCKECRMVSRYSKSPVGFEDLPDHEERYRKSMRVQAG